MRYQNKMRAFTLVELLVVISIIGMLMALLLPAVNGAREAARSTQCKNNMRNLAVAIANFEGRQRKFPGYRNPPLYQGGPNVSWALMLMPDLEANDVYDAWSSAAEYALVEATYKDIFSCASNPPLNTTRGSLAFVGNAGYTRPWNNGSTPADTDALHGSGKLQNNNRSDGVFLDAGRNVNMSTDFIGSRDGQSSTLLLSENIAGGFWDVVDLPLPSTVRELERKVHGVFVWHDSLNTNTTPGSETWNAAFAINGGVKETTDPTDNSYKSGDDTDTTRPSSFHSGGVNAVFADQHVVFLRDNVDYHVFVALMTPHNKSCSHSGKYGTNNKDVTSYVLDDGDYQ